MPEAGTSSNNKRPSTSSAARLPEVIDGSEVDKLLARSELLTRKEVLKRRVRRVKQLARMYRESYWKLMEQLKVKYRGFYWDYGKSPFQEDGEENNQNNNNNDISDENESNGERGRCGVHGCKSKAMALTKFCHMHVLSDPKQKLYKACNYAIKSSPTGPILCGKPILRSMVPSYCFLHFQKAEKHINRALKKAGLNVTSTSKLAPKFNNLLAEYLNQIQTKRRDAKKAALESAEMNEDVSI